MRKKNVVRTLFLSSVLICSGCLADVGIQVVQTENNKYVANIRRSELNKLGYEKGDATEFVKKVVIQQAHNCPNGYKFISEISWREGGGLVAIAYSCNP